MSRQIPVINIADSSDGGETDFDPELPDNNDLEDEDASRGSLSCSSWFGNISVSTPPAAKKPRTDEKPGTSGNQTSVPPAPAAGTRRVNRLSRDFWRETATAPSTIHDSPAATLQSTGSTIPRSTNTVTTRSTDAAGTKRIIPSASGSIKNAPVSGTSVGNNVGTRRVIIKSANVIKKTKYPCHQCPVTTYYASLSSFNKHVKRTHVKPHRCEERNCGQRFGELFQLRNHMIKAHGCIQLYKCTKIGCEEEFQNNTQLYNHIRVVHNKTYCCPTCDQSFVSRKKLETHIYNNNCNKSQEVKLTEQIHAACKGSALGVENEEKILAWLQTKLDVPIKRVGTIHLDRAHPSGIVTGSCDGVSEDEQFCVEVKVASTPRALAAKMTLQGAPRKGIFLFELLRAMYVRNVRMGHFVVLYTVTNEYFHAEVKWEVYEEWFEDFLKSKIERRKTKKK